MTGSPYSIVGRRLIERGFCAIPARPNTKVPGILVGGRWLPMEKWQSRYLTRLPTDREIEAWERAPGNPGVCLVLGAASQGVVAIDVDTEDGVEPVSRALPYTPARKRGRKGVTLFFRDPGGVDSRAFNRPLGQGRKERLVDVLMTGRQTVMPGSCHPDTGKAYVWTGEKALEDINIDDLPFLPANTIDILKSVLAPLGWKEDIVERKPIAGAATDDGEKTPHRLLNEHALANLDAWVPRLPLTRLRKTSAGWEAVPDWRSSCTGRPIMARKLNLKIIPQGIMDFGDGPKGYTAIDLVIACGTAYGDAAFSWLADATGWGSETFHDPKPKPTIEVSGVVAGAETGEVIEIDMPTSEQNQALAPQTFHDPKPRAIKQSLTTEKPKPTLQDKFPWRAIEDPLKCPGLVGEIADWIVASSDYRQPLLAMGAALTVVGTVAGRQLAGPTRSGTHVYVIGVAPTGAGKDHPLRAIGTILRAAKLSSLIGPGKFSSERAILNTIVRSPVCACAVDEFGGFIGRVKGKNASSHERGIIDSLRSFYNASFSTVETAEMAGVQFDTLHWPALSLYGTSTAEEFYDAIGDAETRNGFLNRFLILESPGRPKPCDAVMEKNIVPQSIIDGVLAVRNRLGDIGGLVYCAPGNVAITAEPVMVPWRDEFAKLCYDELRENIFSWMDREPQNDKFIARTAEIAVRAATIRAIGIDPRDPRVTVEDMAWGAAIALKSANAMIEGARDRIVENERGRWVSKVIAMFKKKNVCSTKDVQMNFGRHLRSSDIKDIFAGLIEEGVIEMIDVTNPDTDARKKIAYRYLR